MPLDTGYIEEELAQRALSDALRALNRRERSAAQIRELLEKKEYQPELIEVTVQQLVEQRFVDDRRFTEQLIADKRLLQGWGSERILKALETAGIDNASLESWGFELREGELTTACELLTSRFRDGISDDRQRAKAFAFLRRKGYPSGLCYEAVRASAE